MNPPDEPYTPPLSVKVMRIATPSLASRVVPMFETCTESGVVDEPSDHNNTPHRQECVEYLAPRIWDVIKSTYARGSDEIFTNAPITARDVSYTDQLLLPASFGSVSVGETFQAVICVSNTSTMPIQGMRVKVEMHTDKTDSFPSSSHSLNDVSLPSLAPGAQMTALARHSIDKLAMHALVCRIWSDRHTSQGTHPHSFSKQYRFKVHPPPFLMRSEVHTNDTLSFYHDRSIREQTLVLVSVHNTSSRPLRLDMLSIDPDQSWSASAPKLDHMPLMPKDVRNFVFTLSPRETMSPLHFREKLQSAEHTRVACTVPLGHILIAWRVPGGEMGRLRIGTIQRTTYLPCAVQGMYPELFLDRHDAWLVDEPCHVTMHLHIWVLDLALLGTRLDIALEIDDAWHDILVLGPNRHTASLELLEHTTLEVPWTLVPLRRGLASSGGFILRRVDTNSTLRVWKNVIQFHS